METKLVLKNYFFGLLFGILDVPLHGDVARARNRFAKLLNVEGAKLDAEKMKLIEQYGKKGEDGKPALDATGLQYDLADREGYRKAYEEVLNRDFEITVDRQDFLSLKDVVLHSNKPLDIAETETYEAICEAFEKIK